MKNVYFILSLLFLSCNPSTDVCSDTTFSTGGMVSDIDGNTYQTINIGTQTWMVQNLKVTHFTNGDPIPNITTSWGILTGPSYCCYDNDSTFVDIYGNLYNYYAVADTRSIAPVGWHVPTADEWHTLRTYLGEYASLKMRMENWNGCNTSGFSALPAGRKSGTTFSQMGSFTGYWSSTNVDATYAKYVKLSGANSEGYPSDIYKNQGYSIRCIKD